MKIVLCCLGLALLGSVWAQSPPPNRALGVLERSFAAQPSLRFAGVRMLEVRSGPHPKKIIEYVLRDGMNTRITFPEDSPRRGFVIVERGDERITFDPHLNEIRHSRGVRIEAVGQLGRVIRGVRDGAIRAQLFQGGEVAGRPTVGVSLSDGHRNVARKYWIDEQTGLILRGEQYDRVGYPMGSFEFTRLNFNPQIPEGAFVLRRAGAKVVEESLDIQVPWPIFRPTWVPEGFEEIGHSIRRLGPVEVVVMHYTDGRKHFSIFQGQGRQIPRIPLEREEWVSRSQRVERNWLVAIGNVASETLERVLRSVR